MPASRQIWFTACLVVSACLWLPTLATSASDKKKDEKKKIEPIFSKDEELTDKDEKDTHPFLKRSPRKDYPIKLTERKIYQIDLKSKDFDAVLRLEDSTGKEVAFNDDAPGEKTLNARILYKATASAEYKIIATCLNANAGKFSLLVIEAVGLTSASVFKGKAIDLMLKDGKARYTGELLAQDGIAYGHYYKAFALQLEAGKRYRIDHQSPDFDAYLILEDSHGNVLAEDAGNNKRNSRIVRTATKTGAYRVIATSVAARATGKIVLDVAPDLAAK